MKVIIYDKYRIYYIDVNNYNSGNSITNRNLLHNKENISHNKTKYLKSNKTQQTIFQNSIVTYKINISSLK